MNALEISQWFLDALLGLGLVWLSWRCISSDNLFQAIILFMVLGLLMALAWARLAAPDLALAEAGLGTGLTGALLLEAYRVLGPGESRQEPGPDPLVGPSLAVAIAALLGGLGWALLQPATPAFDPGVLVREHLGSSGVDHPVTGVLLNFRSYDTLLEVLVLVLALVGTWTVTRVPPPVDARTASVARLALLGPLIRLLVPLTVLMSAYLLWAGAHSPGGAFQAGTVLAGLGVLLTLGERVRVRPTSRWPTRSLVILGPALFCVVALLTLGLGGRLLEYPLPWAGGLILFIETGLTLSIGLILALLFAAAPDLDRHRP